MPSKEKINMKRPSRSMKSIKARIEFIVLPRISCSILHRRASLSGLIILNRRRLRKAFRMAVFYSILPDSVNVIVKSISERMTTHASNTL